MSRLQSLLPYVTFSSTGGWNLWTNLFDFDREETPGEIIFFRLFELFVIAGTIYLAWSWGQYIVRISDIVLPLGIAIYVNVSFMFGNTLPLINAGIISALTIAGFLRLSRYAYFVAFLLLHLQFVSRFVLGEIPHSSNVLGMTLLGIGLTMMFFQNPRIRRRFTLGFTYFFIGLGYTSAAFCKFIGTGLHWADGRHLWLWIHEKGIDAFALTGSLEFNALQEVALGSFAVATLFLLVGLISELFAFLMWWRPLRTPLVLAVIGLHIGIYWTMNIMFTLTFMQLILLALPWGNWIDRLLPHRAKQMLMYGVPSKPSRYAVAS